MNNKKVLVFKNKLFLYSETFIKEQVENTLIDQCYYFSTSRMKNTSIDTKKKWVSVYGSGFFADALKVFFERGWLTYSFNVA